MSLLKEIRQGVRDLMNKSSDQPRLTENIAQQLRDEAEHGSMYLPPSLQKGGSQRSTINDQRSTSQNG